MIVILQAILRTILEPKEGRRMPPPTHPVRRCSPCDKDWPATSEFNLCPRCQRNTYAGTSTVVPEYNGAKAELILQDKVRAFDAEQDAIHAAATDAWVIEWNALLAETPSIGDPEDHPHA